MTKKHATLAEVAQAAGVSPVSVSLAIRNQNGRVRVSEKTRKRILDVATQLDYHPNPSARNLALSRTHQIGVYLNSPKALDLSLTPWHAVISAIQLHLAKIGYRLSFYYFPKGMREGFREFLIPNRFVDGLIVQGRVLEDSEIRTIRKSGLPTVSLYHVIEGFHSLTIDEAQTGADAADYLYAAGHRRVALFALRMKRPEWNRRMTGFIQRAREIGLLLPGTCQIVAPIGNRLAGSTELPEELFHRLETVRKNITAIYCPSDYLSIALVRAFDAKGIRVGRDISLLSYDNLEGHGFKPWRKPRLTTFNPPFSEIGAKIVKLLVPSAYAKKRPSPTHHSFVPTLIERDSVEKWVSAPRRSSSSSRQPHL